MSSNVWYICGMVIGVTISELYVCHQMSGIYGMVIGVTISELYVCHQMSGIYVVW